jgi:sulfur-oxidizing protein SoxY
MGLTRRRMLAGAGFVTATLAWPLRAAGDEGTAHLVEQLTGKVPVASDRVHLVIPRSFPNGYTVPLSLAVDSPMTESDHVRSVRVLAPRNPLVEVAAFHFTRSGAPRVETRIRLAEPQDVVAVAEMNDGTLLMTTTWVEVATNGCT